mmetsp:Transcript_6157/g.7534  ORF Transcript_6157/g.7534 Transcript_6157/m.7534 type:complete len:139 (+) Transcript_6157:134-550(+)|eukprot:jgi/Bigna1/89750/estExt_fgenesh1_pg.C_550006
MAVGFFLAVITMGTIVLLKSPSVRKASALEVVSLGISMEGLNKPWLRELLRLRGGGAAELRRKKRTQKRQIWYRSNHKTIVRKNIPAHKMLHNKKRQGIVGIKRIIKDVQKKEKAKVVRKRKKRWRKIEVQEKFKMFG